MIKKSFYVLLAIAMAVAAYGILGRDSNKLVLDNAYVSGRVIRVSATADGIVGKYSIKRSDHVQKGESLFNINDSTNDAKLLQYKEQLRMAIEGEILSCKDVSLAHTTVKRVDLKIEHADNTLKRADALARVNMISVEALEGKKAEQELGNVDKEAAQQEYERSLYKNHSPIFQRPQVQFAIAQLRGAFMEREAERISAPYDGYVYEVFAYPGSYVKKGEDLLVLIPHEPKLIEANVLESEMGMISTGEQVTIEPDIGGGKLKFSGTIQSIVPSIAATFSQLPRNNLDSNWIKTTQRIPILIAMESMPESLNNLPLGSSVKVVADLNTLKARGSNSAQAESAAPRTAQGQESAQELTVKKFESYLQGILAEYQAAGGGRAGACH